MMEILTEYELRLRKREILKKIAAGAVFIYPTDTIYGLGGDATNAATVKRIRDIKERPDKPFSVCAPSKEWIRQQAVESQKNNSGIDTLPGPYTLIITLNQHNTIALNVNPENDTLGVRLPNHWFAQYVEEMNIPIITTSVNKTNEPFMTSFDDLDPDIEKNVDFIIYEGEKKGKPSKIIDLNNEKMIDRG